MITFDADVGRSDLSLESFHGGFGGQDAVLSDQTDDLGPKGDEGDEVDDRK